MRSPICTITGRSKKSGTHRSSIARGIRCRFSSRSSISMISDQSMIRSVIRRGYRLKTGRQPCRVCLQRRRSSQYGGEEFAIIFPERTLEEALELCERVREAIHGLHHPELDGRRVTVSIGLSSYIHGSGKSRFFAETDALLYQAKHTGKNNCIRKPFGIGASESGGFCT